MVYTIMLNSVSLLGGRCYGLASAEAKSLPGKELGSDGEADIANGRWTDWCIEDSRDGGPRRGALTETWCAYEQSRNVL
jgi:hypothetical protein